MCNADAGEDSEDRSGCSKDSGFSEESRHCGQRRCAQRSCDSDLVSTFLHRQTGDLGDQDDANPDRDEGEDRQQRKKHCVDVESAVGVASSQDAECRPYGVAKAGLHFRCLRVVAQHHVEQVNPVGPCELRLRHTQRQHHDVPVVHRVELGYLLYPVQRQLRRVGNQCRRRIQRFAERGRRRQERRLRLPGRAHGWVDEPARGAVDSQRNHIRFAVAGADHGDRADDRHYRRYIGYTAGCLDCCGSDAPSSCRADDPQRSRPGNPVPDIIDRRSDAGGFDHDGDDDGHTTAEGNRGQQRAQEVSTDRTQIDEPQNTESRCQSTARHATVPLAWIPAGRDGADPDRCRTRRDRRETQ